MRAVITLSICLLVVGIESRRAAARPRPQQPTEAPDTETLAAQFEENFAAAIAATDADGEPLLLLQTWGTVMMSATMVEMRRHREAGLDLSGVGEVASESVLARWQELRPHQAGPHLFRLLQIQGNETRIPGLLDLVARYPEDRLLLWQTGQTLRAVGEVERATGLLESYVEQNPQNHRAYAVLAEHYDAIGNTTGQVAALRRWADLSPDDPTLISRWLQAGLDRIEPQGTAVLLEQFMASGPAGSASLQICLQLARGRGLVLDEQLRDGARQCVARIAAGAEGDSELEERAVKGLAELAAIDGDWTALLDNLASLDGEAQVSTLVASARALESPARCSEVIELLSAAFEIADTSGNQYRSIASAAYACNGRPSAQQLFLDLLANASPTDTFSVLNTWAFKVNGDWRGKLPPSTASLLEARLEAEAGPAELYRALDVTYRLEGDQDRHFDLLQRWQAGHSQSLGTEHVTSLVQQLAARGRSDEALDLLEIRLGKTFSTVEAELLWQLLALPQTQAGTDRVDELEWRNAMQRADRFATELAASTEPLRAAYGQLLAARGALARGDIGAAEGHYLSALLTADPPRQEWAIEMLSALGSWASTDVGGAQELEPDQLASLAFQVCDQTHLKDVHRGVASCTRTLLLESGNPGAVDRLGARGRELPADPRSLERLAFQAQAAGDAVLAERAWRRLVEVDPLDPDGWVHLAVFLQKERHYDELGVLLDESRRTTRQPPVDLLRAVARARISQNRADEAIDLLQEARAALPEAYSPAWIDAELRQAYAVLGSQQSAADRVAARSREVSAQGGVAEELPDRSLENADAQELLAAAEALRSGSGGRYDPAAAETLIGRAAAEGSPLAAYRMALVTADATRVSPSQVATVEALAHDGDAYAQYLVGTGALTGVAHPLDHKAARRWLELAAEQDQSWAHHNLGYMKEAGLAFPEADTTMARDAYGRAGDLGNVSSLYDFARLALTPYASGAICRDGIRRLERAATAGHPMSVAYLGKLLFYGQGDCVAPDPAAAINWLEQAADIGDSGASYDLGLALLLNSAGDPPSRRGLALLREVAELPDALAIETLFLVHGSGVFAQRDAARARVLLDDAARLGSDGMSRLRREAASPPFQRLLEESVANLERLLAQGDLEAQTMLAAFLLQGPYAVGTRTLRDAERGAGLALSAAEAGDPWAMRLLITALDQGDGVDRDPDEAMRWTRRAADLGDVRAMYALALEMLSGKRLDLDSTGGIAWLNRAADGGHWQAIGELGRIYAEGRAGVAPDPDQAARWKRQRAALGDAEARGWLRANGYASP